MDRRLHKATRACIIVVAVALGGCSRAPSCNDPEVLRQVTTQLGERTAADLSTRFQIPFLSVAATDALVVLFKPDQSVVQDGHDVPAQIQDDWRHCAAPVRFGYSLTGRVEKARSALEHGAVTGQTLAYILEGEPYLSSLRKLAVSVEGSVSYRTSKTGDDQTRVQLDTYDLPLF